MGKAGNPDFAPFLRAQEALGGGLSGKRFIYTVPAPGKGVPDSGNAVPGAAALPGPQERRPVLPGKPGGGLCQTIDSFTLEQLLAILDTPPGTAETFIKAKKLLHSGGWQSWSAGWELAGGERLPRKVRVIPELIKLTAGPGDEAGGGETKGHFIMYLRSGDYYLCFASLEGRGLPPLGYRVNRERSRFGVEVYCPGKQWREGEKAAELCVFFAAGFFAFKDSLKKIYAQDFTGLDFLKEPGRAGENAGSGGAAGHGGGEGAGWDARPGGCESWYNHYTHIDEGIILEDLRALSSNDNLIKLRYLDRGRPLVFQIDDGWENAVGEWEVHRGRFPRGLKPLAGAMEEAGYIPGLWLAPFLATKRCRVFSEKPHWLLRDREGKPLVAGFNHLWDRRYYCLDISRADVLAYLRELLDRVIDEWGFRYLKLDFLYTGLFYGNFAEPGAPHEHYERACALLSSRTKTASGKPVAYLGCGLPLGPSYRHFPLSRIGADTREVWDWNLVKMLGHVGRPSAYISLLDTIGRSFMNGAVYLNDPDVIFLRSKGCGLTETEKETIALVNFLLAGQIMVSDDAASLSPADLALAGRVSELYDALADDEYGAKRVDRDVFFIMSRSERRWALVNLRKRAYTLDGKAEREIFLKLADGRALIDHRLSIGDRGISFAPHSCTVLEREE
jgi:alpha-galactosidase